MFLSSYCYHVVCVKNRKANRTKYTDLKVGRYHRGLYVV